MPKTQTAFRLHPDTLARIDKIAEKKHLPRSAIVQIALDEYIERFEADETIPLSALKSMSPQAASESDPYS